MTPLRLIPRWKSVAVSLSVAGFALMACGTQSGARPAASPSASAATGSKAADLRTHLDALLSEHVLLSAKASGAALAGRTDEYTAYAGELSHNGADLGDLLGGALGSDVQSRFDQLWAAHDTSVAQYTAAVAAQDHAAQDKALQDLTNGFVPQFAALFNSATDVPVDSLTDLAREHVQGIRQIIDDQGKRSWTAVTSDQRYAYADMQRMGDALAPAIVRKQASKLPGPATSRAVDLRVTLDQLLQEHLYLATIATDDALAGRTEEFQSASKAVSDNGADLGRTLGNVYGADTETQFDRLWAAHDNAIVDYTLALARKDKAAEDKATSDLDSVATPELASFLAATTGLPKDALTNLLKGHVTTVDEVIDAQADHDFASAARKDRVAAQHMPMIGDALAAATVHKLPQLFPQP